MVCLFPGLTLACKVAYGLSQKHQDIFEVKTAKKGSAMGSECSTIQRLKQLSLQDATTPPPLAGAATAALKIILDIKEYELTDMDLKSLNWLVDGIFQKEHEQLLSHLREDAPDCAICAALAERMKVNQEKI